MGPAVIGWLAGWLAGERVAQGLLPTVCITARLGGARRLVLSQAQQALEWEQTPPPSNPTLPALRVSLSLSLALPPSPFPCLPALPLCTVRKTLTHRCRGLSSVQGCWYKVQ